MIAVDRSVSNRMWLWLVLGLSFVLKVIVILLQGDRFMLDSDDASYLVTARIWLDTGVFTYNDPERPTVFITPAYPAFIAMFMKILGPGFVLEQTLRIVQTMLMTISLYLLFVIGRRIWDERTALWGTGIAAFYLPLWLVSNFLLTEALFVLMLLLLIYCCLRIIEQPDRYKAAWFGLIWALATYVRPTIALWPGVFLILLLVWRRLKVKQLLVCSTIAAVVFVACLAPWWVRNYHVSGGQFIPLTRSSGNPLLLGTFSYGLPSLEEQRTWHATNNLWENDAFDRKWAMERIKTGFTEHPLHYLSWYTIGKFTVFWGDVYYWRKIADIPKGIVWGMHYVLLGLGAAGVWLSRRKYGAVLLISLFAYMSLLHMIYLAHSRYAVVLMPFVALFAGAAVTAVTAFIRKKRFK